MPEKDQQFIFSDAQLSLIKNTFGENDPLIYAVRNVLLQFPLTNDQRNLLKTAMKPEVIEVLKIRILPSIQPTFPLGQIPSLLTTLTKHLEALDVDLMAPLFDAKVKEIAYLEQQFRKLEDLDTPEMILLSDMGNLMGKNEYQRYVDTTAYLFLLGYIDPSLNMIKVIAGTKTETVEEAKTRMTRNSSK